MRKTLLTSLILAGLAASAPADDITLLRGLSYKNVTILSVERYAISYRVGGGGTTVSKSFSEIRTITLSDSDAFNEGEKFLVGKDPDPAKAVAAYDRVDLESGGDWLKRLVQYRRVVALDKAAMTGRATKEWLDLMDAEEAAFGLLDLRPKNFAAKGSAENKRAIQLLEDKMPRVAKRKEYAAAVQQTLMKLYGHEDMTKKADELANRLAASVRPKAGTNGAAGDTSPAAMLDRQLAADRSLIREGQTAENLHAALDRLRGNLRRYDESQLSTALLLKGRCEALLAADASGDQKRRLLLAAGLDLMRVVAYYEGTPDAMEALYEAGRVNVALGNKAAARRALTQASRARDAELAAKASAALDALK